MKSLAYWYSSLSPSAAAAILAVIFIAFCIAASAVYDWQLPVNVDRRAKQRERKAKRKLDARLAKLRAKVIRYEEMRIANWSVKPSRGYLRAYRGQS